MKLGFMGSCARVIVVSVLGYGIVFGQSAEPTKQEIAEAYRSKIGEGGTAIPGLRWEKWRVKEIRGWSLKFKRISRKNGPGILSRQYQAVAKQGGKCAEYQIIETMPMPPANPQIKPSLTVEPAGVPACR